MDFLGATTSAVSLQSSSSYWRESLFLSTIFSIPVDAGIFYRITMTSMTQAWYMKLTPFESILLGLVILQV